MKKLELKFSGQGYLAYISFFDKTLVDATNEDSDLLDLIQENEKFSWVVATGLEFSECNLAVNVKVSGEKDLKTRVVESDETLTDAEFEQQFGCSRDSVLVYDFSKTESPLLRSGYSEDDTICYAILEVVKPVSSGGTVAFEVEDDFCLSDIQLAAADFDCISEYNLEALIYPKLNGMEREIRSVEYRGKFYPISDLGSVGGHNYFYGFERHEEWRESPVLEDLLSRSAN